MFKNIFVFFLISLFSTFNSSYALHYFNNNVTFNQNYIDEYLKFVDYSTHYTGHYGDNKQTMYITGISGGGNPYFILGGFISNMLGKTVKVTCDNKDFGFTEQDFTVEDYYGNGDLYDIEEKEFYGHVYGF